MKLARRGQQGQMLVMFCLLLTLIIAFVAMTIDVGLIFVERREMQNAADAAALAGAAALPPEGTAPQAIAIARDYAKKNGFEDGVNGANVDVITPYEGDPQKIEVKISGPQPAYFAVVLGKTSFNVHAHGAAGMGAPASLSGVLPFGVLESEIDYDSGPTVIKWDAQGGSSGNRGALRIDGSGAAVYRDSIKYGSEESVCAASQPACEDPTVPTETGNIIGPTREGFDYRFSNTSTDCDEFNEVLIAQGDGTYRVNARCNPFSGASDSLRLVLIPVIDAFPSGTKPVTVQYFSVMFLNDFDPGKCQGNNCEVTGTFVRAVFDPGSDAELGVYDEESGLTFVRLVE